MYIPNKRWDVLHVPINHLLMTKPIYNAIKNNNGNIKGLQFHKDPKNPGFEMNRMENMITAFKNKEKLPPIVVKRVGSFYSIQDGRHRFASSILFGYEKVPIIIMESVHFD